MEVIGALAAQDRHEAPPPKIGLTEALYLGDQLATRKKPPDVFPPEPWNTAHLQALGVQKDILAWEKLTLGPNGEAH